jgi:hypothetical protein
MASSTAVLLACATVHYGLFHFGGMDGGVCCKGAWMCYLGYRPYVDFPAVCSPDYLLLGKLALVLFGIKWTSFVYLGACVSAVSFLFHWLLLKELLISLPVRWLVAMSTQLCTFVPLGWLSYNQTASVVGSIFITALAAVLLPQSRPRSFIYLAIATLLLLFVKPNTACFLAVTGYAVILCRSRWRKRAAPCLVTALVLWALLLWSQGIDPLALIRSYHSASGRLGSARMLSTCLYTSHPAEAKHVLPIVAAILMLSAVFVIGALVRSPRDVLTSPHYAVAMLGSCAGLIALATNNELTTVAAPMVIAGVTVLVFALPGSVFGGRVPRTVFRALLVSLVVLLDACAIQITCTRYRICTIGPGSFFEPGPTYEVSDGSFFRGMHVGPRLVAVDDQIRFILAYRAATGHMDSRIYFGPRIEFAYPAYGIAPAKGLPLWFSDTGEIAAAQLAPDVRSFENAKFQICVFLKNDFTYIPSAVLQYLGRSYVRYQTGELTVFVRRDVP